LAKKLLFLGTGAGGFRGSSRLKSSIYFDGLLFDCGAGVAGRLEDLGLVDKLEAVFITHLHSDHLSGLYDLLVSMVVEGRNRPLTIYSPPGLTGLLEAYSSLGNKLCSPETGFSISVLEPPRVAAKLGGLEVRAVELDHVVQDFGYVVKWDSGTLAYSGDTREPSSLLDLKVDYLIHEATFTERFKQVAKTFGHTTALEAARVAQAMGAKKLYITHVGNRGDTPEDKLREAQSVFPDTEMPDDLEEYSV